MLAYPLAALWLFFCSSRSEMQRKKTSSNGELSRFVLAFGHMLQQYKYN